MKRLIAFALMLAACAPTLGAQTSASFTGKWDGTVKMQRPDGTEGSTNPVQFNLTQKGEELTGTAGPPDQHQAIEKGFVSDGKATFQAQPGPLYKFTLTIVAGRLQGEMTGERDGVVRVRAKVDAVREPGAASPQTTGGNPAPVPNAAPQERKEITVPEDVLKNYVGEYELTSEQIVIKITFENGSLWGEPAGSPKRQLFAETESKFFLKSSPTEVTFQKDAGGHVTGFLMKSGTRPEVTLKKVK